MTYLLPVLPLPLGLPLPLLALLVLGPDQVCQPPRSDQGMVRPHYRQLGLSEQLGQAQSSAATAQVHGLVCVVVTDVVVVHPGVVVVADSSLRAVWR